MPTAETEVLRKEAEGERAQHAQNLRHIFPSRTTLADALKRMVSLRERGIDVLDEFLEQPGVKERLERAAQERLPGKEAARLRDALIDSLVARERQVEGVRFKLVDSRVLVRLHQQSEGRLVHPREEASKSVLLTEVPPFRKLVGQVLHVQRGPERLKGDALLAYEPREDDIVVASAGFHPEVAGQINQEFEKRHRVSAEMARIPKYQPIQRAGLMHYRVVVTPEGLKLILHRVERLR